MKHTLFGCMLLAATLSCISAKTSGAGSGDWKFIADKIVDFGLDRDVIRFGDISDDFRQLKLRVTDAPVRFFDMKVYFDNGDVQDVPLRAVIPQGGESRAIDLNGGLRHLSKIEFHYKPAAHGRLGRARVAVWGRG